MYMDYCALLCITKIINFLDHGHHSIIIYDNITDLRTHNTYAQ